MMLALLEEIPSVDLPGELAAPSLIRAARSAGWRYARARRRERPADWLENVADSAGDGFEDTVAEEAEHWLGVVVPRPAGPDGLRAVPRVFAPAGQVEAVVLTGLAGDYGLREVVGRARRQVSSDSVRHHGLVERLDSSGRPRSVSTLPGPHRPRKGSDCADAGAGGRQDDRGELTADIFVATTRRRRRR
ncbi:hypothetical protein [Streptomyces tremellae]|uniref:Uncharacterized protein n=1 Tax=Streptomyces tremellae TaxID=1124239 RepID=A0ABP7FVV8_9ACTN